MPKKAPSKVLMRTGTKQRKPRPVPIDAPQIGTLTSTSTLVDPGAGL